MRTGKKYYLNSNEVTIGKRQYGIEIADNPVVSKHHAMQSGGAIVLIVFFIAGGVGGISVSILGLVVYNLTNTGGKK